MKKVSSFDYRFYKKIKVLMIRESEIPSGSGRVYYYSGLSENAVPLKKVTANRRVTYC